MTTIKLIISGILLIVWFLATLAIGFMAIVTIFPLIILIIAPEVMLLWFIPAGILLVFGGWIDQEQLDRMFPNENANVREVENEDFD